MKMLPSFMPSSALLSQTADQWNTMTDTINSLSEAIQQRQDFQDEAALMVWQASLLPKTIALKGEAAKFANCFNNLVSNIEVDEVRNNVVPGVIS